MSVSIDDLCISETLEEDEIPGEPHTVEPSQSSELPNVEVVEFGEPEIKVLSLNATNIADSVSDSVDPEEFLRDFVEIEGENYPIYVSDEVFSYFDMEYGEIPAYAKLEINETVYTVEARDQWRLVEALDKLDYVGSDVENDLIRETENNNVVVPLIADKNGEIRGENTLLSLVKPQEEQIFASPDDPVFQQIFTNLGHREEMEQINDYLSEPSVRVREMENGSELVVHPGPMYGKPEATIIDDNLALVEGGEVIYKNPMEGIEEVEYREEKNGVYIFDIK